MPEALDARCLEGTKQRDAATSAVECGGQSGQRTPSQLQLSVFKPAIDAAYIEERAEVFYGRPAVCTRFAGATARRAVSMLHRCCAPSSERALVAGERVSKALIGRGVRAHDAHAEQRLLPAQTLLAHEVRRH
eukprot:3860312-Prymnesium_polylepis.1